MRKIKAAYIGIDTAGAARIHSLLLPGKFAEPDVARCATRIARVVERGRPALETKAFRRGRPGSGCHYEPGRVRATQ